MISSLSLSTVHEPSKLLSQKHPGVPGRLAVFGEGDRRAAATPAPWLAGLEAQLLRIVVAASRAMATQRRGRARTTISSQWGVKRPDAPKAPCSAGHVMARRTHFVSIMSKIR